MNERFCWCPETLFHCKLTVHIHVCVCGVTGTGKTLLARAVASQLDANFLKVVSSAIVDKYIGESARLIREMFGKCHDISWCPYFRSLLLPPLLHISLPHSIYSSLTPFLPHSHPPILPPSLYPQHMPEITNLASSSWMRLMPLVGGDSPKAHQQIARSSALSWSC